jgi:ribonuclease HI
MKKPSVSIYTDGACKGNPGPGGWGAILQSGPHLKELKGFEAETTNNRMELMGVIEALKALKAPSDIRLVSDSRYVLNGLETWLKGWKARGWKTADKKPVKNADLWIELDTIMAPHSLKFEWVKGHNGHEFNERADQLANEAIEYGLNPQGQN